MARLTTEHQFATAPEGTVVRHSLTGIRYRKDTESAWYPQNDPLPAGIRHREMTIMAFRGGEMVVEGSEYQHTGFEAGVI